MFRVTAAIALAVALGITASATASVPASVVAVNYRPGGPSIDVVVAIPKGIDNAARTGNADWGIRIVLTYVSANNTVETLDSGRLSLANDTQVLESSDHSTDNVLATLQFGSTPPPGANPGYSALVELLPPGA